MEVNKSTAANNRFALLREKCKIHVFLSQELLSLTENWRSEARNRRKAASRYAQSYSNTSDKIVHLKERFIIEIK